MTHFLLGNIDAMLLTLSDTCSLTLPPLQLDVSVPLP